MTVSETAAGTRGRTTSKSATPTETKTTARKAAEKTTGKAASAAATARRATTAQQKNAARKTTTRKTAAESATARKPPERRHDGHGFTVNLPMMTVQFRPPHLHLPHVSRQEAGHAVDAAKSFLPPAERMAYYGGLGALAVAGLIEWPVAAAIGVGTMIAQRARRKERSARSAS